MRQTSAASCCRSKRAATLAVHPHLVVVLQALEKLLAGACHGGRATIVGRPPRPRQGRPSPRLICFAMLRGVGNPQCTFWLATCPSAFAQPDPPRRTA